MSVQAIHLLALLFLFPATIASLVWFGLAANFRGGFGVTWRSVALSGAAFSLLLAALIYVLYHPHALPALLGSLPAPPPNPSKVS